MINRTCLAVLIGLLGLACGLQCPKQKLSPGREVVCYTFVSDVDQLTEAVCKCTSLVQQGYDVRNLSVSGFEDFQKSLKKIIPTLQFVVSVDDPGKTLSTSGTVRQEITARLIGVLKEVDGVELNMTAGSKERLVHFVKGLQDELVRKSYDKRIFLVLPTKSEELAKQFDLKELTKYVDLFTVPTHYLVEDDEANHAFHPSRLMGLFDMFNADSLIDLISGLGAPKRKILVSVPATAYKFTLKDQDDNAPRALTEEMQPVTIDQKQLCDLMNNGEWTVERDEDLTAPYAFKDKMWIAFEDRISLSIKGKYVLLRDLPGLAVHDVENDFKTNCGMPLTHVVHRSFSNFKRKSRAAVLNALEDDLHQKELEYSTKVKSSDFRVVRVVDTEGHIRVVRENTQTEFTCSRQGYFVHPKSCNRFYRCVKFNQEVEDYSVFEFDCPAGLSFDERTEVCVWPGSMPEGSPCPGSSEIAPVTRIRFECPSKSGYYADPQNPRWFFACIDLGGPEIMAYEFRCPFGLIFDEQKLICEWPWLVAGYSGTGYTRSEYDGGYYGTGTTAGTGGYYTGALPHGYTGTSGGGGGYTVATGSGFSGAAGVGHGSSFGQGTKYTGSGKGKGYSGSGQGAGYTGSGVAGHGTSYTGQGFTGTTGSGYSGTGGASSGTKYTGQGFGGHSGTTISGYSGTAGAGHGTTYSGQGSGGYSETTGSGYSGTGGAGSGTKYTGQGFGGHSGTTIIGYSGTAGVDHGSTYSGQGSGGYSGTTGSGYSGAAGAGHGISYTGQEADGYSGAGAAGHGTTYIGQGSGGYSGTTGSGYSGTGGAGYGTKYTGQGFGGHSGTTASGYSGTAGAGHRTTYSGQGSSGYSGTAGSGYSGTGGAGSGIKYTGQGFGGHSGTTISGYSGTAGIDHGSTYSGQESGGHSETTGGEYAGAAGADHGTSYTGQGFTGTTGSGYSGAGATQTSGHGYSETGTSYTGSTGKAGYEGSTGTGYSGGTGTGQVSTDTGAGFIEQAEKSGATGTGYTGSTYSAAGSTDGGYSGTKGGSIGGEYPGTKSGSSGGGYSSATGGTTGGYAGPGGIHGGSTGGGYAGSTAGGYTGAGTTSAHAGSTAGGYTGEGTSGAHAGSTGGYAGPGGIHGGSTGGGYAGSTAGGYTGAGTSGAHAGSTGGYAGSGGIHGGFTGGGYAGSTAGGYTGAGTSGAHAGSTGGYVGPGGIHGGSTGGGYAGSTADGYTGAGTSGAHAGSTGGYAGSGGIHGGFTGGGYAGSTAGGYTGAGTSGAHAGSTGGYVGPGGIHGGSTGGGYAGSTADGYTGAGKSGAHAGSIGGYTGTSGGYGGSSIPGQTFTFGTGQSQTPIYVSSGTTGAGLDHGVTSIYSQTPGPLIVEKPGKPSCLTNLCYGSSQPSGSQTLVTNDYVSSHGGISGTNVYQGTTEFPGSLNVTFGSHVPSIGGVTYHGSITPAGGYTVTAGTGAIVTGHGIQGSIITGGSTPGTLITHGATPGTIFAGSSDQGTIISGGSHPGYTKTGLSSPGYVISGGIKTVFPGSASSGTTVYGTPSPGIIVTGTPSPGVVVTGTPSPGVVVTGTPSPGTIIKGQSSPGIILTGQTAPGVSIGGSIVPGTVIGSGFPTHPGAVTPGSPFGTKIGTTPSTYVTGYKTNEYHDNGGRGTIRFNNGDVTTKYTENDIPDYRPTGGNTLPNTFIPGSKGIPGVSISSGFTKTGPTKTGFTTATLGGGGSYVISTGKTSPPPNPDHIGAKAFEGNVAGFPKSSTESSAKTYSGTFSTYGPGFSQGPSKGTGYSYPTPSIPFDTGVTKNLPISSTESDIFSGTTPTPFLKVEVHNTPKFGEAGFTSSPAVVNTYQKPSGFTRAPSPTGTPVLYTTGPLENYKTTVFEAAKVPVTISTIHPVIDTGYQTVISSTPLPVTISQDKFGIQSRPQFSFGTKTSQPGIFGDRGYVSSTTPTTIFKISSKYPSGEPQYDYGPTTPSSGSGYSTTSKSVFEHVTPSGISESPKPQTQYIPGESISPAIGVTYRKPFPLPGVTYQQEFTPASGKSYTTAPSGIGSGPGYKGSPTNIAIPRDEVGKLVTNYNRGSTKYVPNQYDVYTTGSAAGVDYYQSQSKFKQGYDSSTPSSVPRTQSPLTVTTYSGGYSKPSSGITYQTTAKSTAVGKPKVIVKWSDLHPLLLGKLGAECTCRGDPFANLRGPGSKLINSSKGKVDLSNYDESEIYVDLEKEGSYEDQDYQVTNYESSSKQPVKIYNDLSKALEATSIQVQEKPSSTYLPSVTPFVGVGGRTSGLSGHGLTANFRSGKSLSNVGSPINSIAGGKGLASTVDHFVIGPIDGSANSPTDDSVDGPIDRSGEYEDSVSEEIIDGATNCARPGLFRHPNFCNKFYACHWDEWKKKFTLHTFNCPVHLTFDNGAGACNWPSMGPACQDNNLLV